MAWVTEQILADCLNKCEDFSILKKQFLEIMADEIVLYHGTSTYVGKVNVLEFFERTSDAISSEVGFIAAPVIISDTEDLPNGIVAEKIYKAVALFSKLEEYASWFST